MKKYRISKVWIIVGVLVVLAVAAWLATRSKDETKISFTTAKVEPANIQNSVTATGTIEPVTSVTVGTQVSGIVSHLYVDYNSQVKKGQVIAELDKTNLISTLSSAKASLRSAVANVAKAKADYQRQVANLNYQRANFNRYATLYRKGLTSANDYDNARLALQQAQEQVASSNQLVAQAEQQVTQSRAQVSQAETNLGYATITSPIDGVVLSKSVEEGQTVAASFSTPELFTIAKDLTNMQVVADVDEADIGDVKKGERVSFTVDAYPDNTFSGVVTQVRQEATTSNNVVTYQVVISAPNKDLKLKPGLTAERKGVLSVPSKALRFTPTQETLGKKYKIVDVAGAKNKVWTLKGNVLTAHKVNIGMTDGMHTQILGGISRDETVITDLAVSTPSESSESSDNEQSPFAPGPKRSDKKK